MFLRFDGIGDIVCSVERDEEEEGREKTKRVDAGSDKAEERKGRSREERQQGEKAKNEKIMDGRTRKLKLSNVL